MREPEVLGIITPDPRAVDELTRGLERLGYKVLVEKARGQAEASTAIASLARHGVELVIVPGSWIGPWDVISQRLGVKVVRGAWSPLLTLEIIRRWGVSRLSPRLEAEKTVYPDMARVAVETLNSLKATPPAGTAFRLDGVPLPLRPPPILVASEVYVRTCDAESVASEVYWRMLEGADIVSLGWDGSVSIECYWRVLRRLLDEVPGPVAADPGRPELAVEAAKIGAGLSLSLTPESLELVPNRLREETAFVVIAPGGPSALEKVAARARELGFERLLLDPVLGPPGSPGSLASLCAAGEAAQRAGYPLMVGVNNVVEMIDADTTGSTALAVALAAEAGASLVLVGEESTKAQGSTWEAWVAAAMAGLSIYWRKPPKDLGLDLLLAKRKGLPRGGPIG